MILNRRDCISGKPWADVFHPPGDDRVYKLFKKIATDVEGRATHAMFSGECRAFELVSECPGTASYVPSFAKVRIERVVDAQGCDVSAGYYLDWCYSTRFIAGSEEDAHVIDGYAWGKRLAAKLEEMGVNAWGDGSVFLAPDKSSGILIDITTRDARNDYPDTWAV